MSAQQQKPRARTTQITPERIRARAYEIYEARNGAPGDPTSDWLQAERELNDQGPDRTASIASEPGAQTPRQRLPAVRN